MLIYSLLPHEKNIAYAVFYAYSWRLNISVCVSYKYNMYICMENLDTWIRMPQK